MNTKKIYGFWVLLLLLGACKSIKPEKPTESYETMTVEKKVSTINVPVQLAIPQAEKTLNKYVKGVLYELKDFSQTGVEKINLKVSKRSDIKLKGQETVLASEIPLQIWAKVEAGSGIFAVNQSVSFSVNLNFSTAFIPTKNWTVKAQTSANGFQWVKKPKISLAGFDIPIDEVLNDVLDKQQAELSKVLDAEISKYLDIKQYAQQAWASSHTVLQLSDTYQTWLRVTPQKIAMTPIVTNSDYIETQIGITAFTETFTGSKPAIDTQKPLPNLEIARNMSNAFEINLTASVSHQYVTKTLKEQFVGKKYSFKDGKYNIQVTDMEVFGSGEFLVVRTDMIGSLKGTVYLKGIPYYDKEKQVIALREVDFDLKTKNVLAKTATWLMHQKFNKRIQEQATIPIKEEIELANAQAQMLINNYAVNNYVTINGRLEELTPEDIIILPEQIVARGIAKGKLKLILSL